MDLLSPLVERHGEFSKCRRWRYLLSIVWHPSKPVLVFVMLNPSTADEVQNDPTIDRCERRARMMGMGGLVILNAYAWRDTEPENLYGLADPVGAENDRWIVRAAAQAVQLGGMVICGWGTHCDKIQPGRSAQVLDLLELAGAEPHALKINNDGSPQHPLYIGYGVQPRPIEVLLHATA